MERPKGKHSILEYTINNSNFSIQQNRFILIDNRPMTIGTKKEGLKDESEKLMFELGFDTQKIICEGNFENTDFESITKQFFKWLRIKATAKLQLEQKYRSLIKEEEVEIKNHNINKITGTIWKLGCNWGTGKPSFFNYIKDEEIIIGVNDKMYNIGDLIVVTEGHQVNAIARISEIPESVTNEKSLKESFEKLEIEYEDWVNFAQAEWHELEHEDKFYYQLQQGICKVQNSDIRTKVIDLWNSRNSSYWIFQGNPNIFDFETAIRNNLLEDWTVSAHKDKIKVGDKIILWITGKNAGCYALAEVTSEPKITNNSRDAHLWKSEDKNTLKAGIRICHNLINTPLLWKGIKNTPGLESFKVGNQGTNFSATKNEYRIIENLIRGIMPLPRISIICMQKI